MKKLIPITLITFCLLFTACKEKERTYVITWRVQNESGSDVAYSEMQNKAVGPLTKLRLESARTSALTNGGNWKIAVLWNVVEID